jgi:hypothetical protein
VEDEALASGWVSLDDRALFKVTNTMQEAAEEVLGFYRNYHSRRWVGDLLVLRVQTQPSKAELNRRFVDIIVCRSIRTTGNPWAFRLPSSLAPRATRRTRAACQAPPRFGCPTLNESCGQSMLNDATDGHR